MPNTPFTYNNRIVALRNRKVVQTKQKIKLNGSMDEDDYGSVPAPKDFSFTPEFNDLENQTFYGTQLWAKNFSNLLKVHPTYVDKNDALAGRWMFILQRLRPFAGVASTNNMEMAPMFDFSQLIETQKLYNIYSGIGKMHHFAPDYSIGLKLGWKGLLEKVEHYSSKTEDMEKKEFYQAEILILQGIMSWISHTVDTITEMKAKETDPEIKANLEEMENVNKQLLIHPPQTFHQVCQWIAWYNMAGRTYNRAGAGCQIDSILLPYYKSDIKKGILTPEKAKFIIACLLLVDPHYYQIGGPDAKGNDITNELSFIILDAADELKTSLNLTIRVHDKLSDKLFEKGIKILLDNKLAYPRFSGDKALIEGFIKNGYSVELARKRIAVGCNWMSLPGQEYTLNDLVKINLAKTFAVAFDEYKGTSVNELYQLYIEHLNKAIVCVSKGIAFHLKNQYRNAPELMLNILCHGPIEKGCDASHGGVEYYNIAVDGAGLGTFADSIAALEEHIDKRKDLTWDQCRRAIATNFSTEEGIYVQSVLKNSPRFGSGDSLGDYWAKKISEDFTNSIISHRKDDNLLLIPGLFSWANTIEMGKVLKASLNGRKAGEPISHGANPNPGFRKDGALTAMSDAIAMVQPGYGNTAPWQLEIDLDLANRDNAVQILKTIIKTHFKKGGTLMNINVVNANEIISAYDDPMAYPNLIVRVTGFSAYFMALSKDFQRMIVERIISCKKEN
jgi:formate C-acetyltransferase